MTKFDEVSSFWKATSYYFKNIPDGLTSLSENRIKFVEILKAQPSSSSQSVWSCKVIEIKDETCQDLSERSLTYFADLEVSQLVLPVAVLVFWPLGGKQCDWWVVVVLAIISMG